MRRRVDEGRKKNGDLSCRIAASCCALYFFKNKVQYENQGPTSHLLRLYRIGP